MVSAALLGLTRDQREGGMAEAEWLECSDPDVMLESLRGQIGDRRVDILRCLFGELFRPITFDPTWRTPAVLHLAQSIYDDQAFDQLPILADALEEAGCASRELLDHCRSPGPHVRGWWVVDLALGKGWTDCPLQGRPSLP